MGAVVKMSTFMRHTHRASEHIEDSDLMAIEVADMKIFAGSPKGLQRIRLRYYGINKHNAAGRRYGTRKISGREMLVFRLS
jgi:hypothetical protein